MQEAVAVALEAVGNPLDLHRVHAASYNVHGQFPSYMTLPDVPAPFYWIDAPWGSALRCRALEDVAPHLFSTRQLELSSETQTAVLAASVGALQLVQANQVHGRAHVVVRVG